MKSPLLKKGYGLDIEGTVFDEDYMDYRDQGQQRDSAKPTFPQNTHIDIEAIRDFPNELKPPVQPRFRGNRTR